MSFVSDTPSRVARAVSSLLLMAWLVACSSDVSDNALQSEREAPQGCIDRIDNDRDGVTDCEDDDCFTEPLCVALGRDAGRDAVTSDAAPADAFTDPDDSTATDAGDDARDAGSADDVNDVGPDTRTDEPDADTGASADTEDAVLADVSPDSTYPVRGCTTWVLLNPGRSVGTVFVAGSFNDWNAAATPLSDPDGDGVWTAELNLPPGEYAHKFIVDGEWDFSGGTAIPDSITVDFYTRWDGNFENRNLIVGDCQRPMLEVVAAESDADSVRVELQFVRAADGALLNPDSLRASVGRVPVEADTDVTTGRIIVEQTGISRRGKYSVRVSAQDTEGRAIEEDIFVPLWVEDVPFVWQDATMYFVFTDRFRNADPSDNNPLDRVPAIANYQGGDFLGVIEAIEEGYFQSLGVNLLWLSPMLDNPDTPYVSSDGRNGFSGFHGYWPISARRVEDRWGDSEATGEERLRQLIQVAHENGIRVMFDVVLNHVHEDHDYVDDFPEWFTAAVCRCTNDPGPCNWNTNPVGCWFIDYLPDLNFKNHAIVQQVTEDLEYLVTEFDVDSFRVDAAKHMDHVIMRRTSLRLRDRFEHGDAAPIYLVGETFTGGDGHGLIMDYVNPWELDGQFDFPLLYPIRDSFAFSVSFRNLSAARFRSQSEYGAHYEWMSPFLGNHDIPRTAQLIADGGRGIDPWAAVPDPMNNGWNEGTWNIVNRMAMAFAFVLTQPGIPLIYYGDEVGLYGGPDPDNRRFMPSLDSLTDPQSELLVRVQRIGRARRDYDALRRGRFVELWVDDDLFVYARQTTDGQVAIVAMNKGATRTQAVPIPPSLGIAGQTFTDVLNPATPRSASVSTSMTITLNPWEYVILVPPRG